jgi:catechol 2,3-dioxygenase-like lactoylglutathione lyase family enzyme
MRDIIAEVHMNAFFKNAWPYADDAMKLPVSSVDDAVPFYETVMGFKVIARSGTPYKSVTLARDAITIGLAENGGDSSQEGCFFEVDNAEAAFAELKAQGLGKGDPKFEVTSHGDTTYKQFFVVAPDGLCYCLGEKLG